MGWKEGKGNDFKRRVKRGEASHQQITAQSTHQPPVRVAHTIGFRIMPRVDMGSPVGPCTVWGTEMAWETSCARARHALASACCWAVLRLPSSAARARYSLKPSSACRRRLGLREWLKVLGCAALAGLRRLRRLRRVCA